MLKLNFTLVFFFLLSFNLSAQKDCSKYKDGIFKLVDKENNLTFYIERKGNIQHEEIEGQNIKFDFEVKWIDECSYTLHPTPETIAAFGPETDFILIVNITEINEKTLKISMYNKDSPKDILTSELIIVNPI